MEPEGYTGYQAWARQRKDEVLLDIDDVAAGHFTSDIGILQTCGNQCGRKLVDNAVRGRLR